MDCSASASVMCTFPSPSGGVVIAASSSALYAERRSPPAMRAMCPMASASASTFILPRPLWRFLSAAYSAPEMSSSDSLLNSNTRHLDTMAGVIEAYGFSVVEPMKIIVPCSMAGSSESLCVLLKRWHSSSMR